MRISDWSSDVCSSDLVAAQELFVRAGVLALVGVLITIAVYGAVALIVKMDDVGLHLAEQRHTAVERRIGRFLLHSMPVLLTLLSAVGTIAMLWVGDRKSTRLNSSH